MKRLNRYPYTRSQWVEETADYHTYQTVFILQAMF